VREDCKEVDKAYDKTEDDLKALQSVGQVSHALPPLPPPASSPPAMLTAHVLIFRADSLRRRGACAVC
jgi:hypothetical protein